MFAKLAWGFWGLWTNAAFRVGLSLVRLSTWDLFLSASTGWGVEYRRRSSNRLWNRAEAAAELRPLLWFACEPHPDAAGAIPWAQHALLVELVAARWWGGCTADALVLLSEVMAAENIVVY